MNEFWTVEGSAVLFYGVIMEVMIPAHLHLETACLEGILHFSGPAFRGRGAMGRLAEGGRRTPRSLLDSGGRQGNEGRWASASAMSKQTTDGTGEWRTGAAATARGQALEEGTGKLSSSSTPAEDGMDLLNPEGRACDRE